VGAAPAITPCLARDVVSMPDGRVGGHDEASAIAAGFSF